MSSDCQSIEDPDAAHAKPHAGKKKVKPIPGLPQGEQTLRRASDTGLGGYKSQLCLAARVETCGLCLMGQTPNLAAGAGGRDLR